MSLFSSLFVLLALDTLLFAFLPARRWAGGAGSPGSTSYALEAGAFPFLVRMLQEKGTLAKPALMAMAALVAAGGRNRAAVCEAIASEGAVAPLVELVGGMDRGTQEAGLDLMLELCRTATKSDPRRPRSCSPSLLALPHPFPSQFSPCFPFPLPLSSLSDLWAMCTLSFRHCAAVALAEGFAALMPLIAMPGAAERPDMCAKACYVLSEIVASISSSR